MRTRGTLIAMGLSGLLISSCGSSADPAQEVGNTDVTETSTASGTGDPDADACAAAAVTLGYADPVVLMMSGPDAVGLQCSIQVSTGAIVQIVVPSDGSPPATISVP